MTEQLYYIQSVKRGYVGNCIVWWGKNRSGYTCHLDQAGQYTASEAIDICRYPELATAHKVQDIKKVATLQVDMQHLKTIK